MCKWGTSEVVEVTIAADLSHSGKEYIRKFKIDKCIAPIVRALEQGGIKMRASCCGHGTRDGYINLQDGRTLIIPNGKAGWKLVKQTDANRKILLRH